MQTYARLPVAFERGEGAWLWDAEGRQYLDALSGIAVCGLGHSHPGVTAAVQEQAARLLHTSNVYRIPNQERLGAALCQLAEMDTAFFCNSGAEANEAAIKLARLYGHQRGISTPTIIVTDGSFHGRTMATLTATGNQKVQQGFEPLVDGFRRVPFDDLSAVDALSAERNIVAILVEPIQGEGGVRLPSAGYLAGLRELCDRNGWLLMLDEIQTGLARTGRWFAFQHENIRPDVMSLAKGLGNGIPIGACLARGEAAKTFAPGKHGTTFGGNHLSCRAGLAVIEAIRQDNLVARAAELGGRMLGSFRQQLQGTAGVSDIRGKGLMLGITLDRPCGELVQRALAEGLLINVTAERVIRLLPPLVISDAQADQIVGTVSSLVKSFLAESGAQTRAG
jgi:acetylornithine/N-succinyldiaminopimelate aminotransferase